MRIDQEKCIGCQKCIPYCPVGAISVYENRKVYISQDDCLECGCCLRSAHCPTDALFEGKDVFDKPRSVRKAYSDPQTDHKEPPTAGRGTEEIKTNDVTGLVRKGKVGLAIEVGRPTVGTTLKDVETITKGLADHGIYLEKTNPLYFLLDKVEKGTFQSWCLEEKVLSCIIEVVFDVKRLKEMLLFLSEVQNHIDTVFTLGLLTRLNDDGTIPVQSTLNELDIQVFPSAKVNLGMGRPLKEV